MLHSGGEAGNLVDYIYCIYIFFTTNEVWMNKRRNIGYVQQKVGKAFRKIYTLRIYIWERCRIIDRMRYE